MMDSYRKIMLLVMQPFRTGAPQNKREKVDSRPYYDYIDGLRCIAILYVLLYHAEIPGFSGAFIGVEIFFVISGFLMTQILTRTDLNAAGLSAFFAARVRRI